MSPQLKLRIFATPADLFQGAAEEFSAQANAAVAQRGKFSVALSGGSTPKSLYQWLASGAFPNYPWDKTYFFFGDERHVPPDDPESNYRMANEAMLSKAPAANVFRIPAEMKDADAAASAYEQTLRTFFRLTPGEFPRFDLILLGLGPDGHTVSLFPGSAALSENKKLVVANWVEKFQTYRITFTFPVLNHAACVMFLACGADKAGILREVLENPQADLPSQRVNPINGRLVWMVDRAAAAELSESH
ncbi:MAG: 6-phosphogluconolactonase [Terriglobales bacterium]|jgi:6-phosphogluconolactonase